MSHPDQKFGGRTYSQHGEDLMLMNIFNQLEIERPRYLDIGAHHPVNISNTYLLYLNGSRGVNVEANPKLYDAFTKLRPEDYNVCVGVSPEGGKLDFLMYDDFSGRNTFSFDEAKTYMREYRHFVTKTVEMNTITLNQVVERYCDNQFPHLLTIDVEGLDYDILKSADLSASRPIVICVEENSKDSTRMLEMLYHHGYNFLIRMGANMIFVHSGFYEALLR